MKANVPPGLGGRFFSSLSLRVVEDGSSTKELHYGLPLVGRIPAVKATKQKADPFAMTLPCDSWGISGTSSSWSPDAGIFSSSSSSSCQCMITLASGTVSFWPFVSFQMVGKHHPIYLHDNRIYTCSTCHSHLLSHDAIISRAFHGRNGPAFLVERVINVSLSVKEERMLMTGMHTVADISCNVCASKIGWKYLRAFEETQKYKENKFIVEKSKVTKEFVWD
ncbi:yippee zinc-binding/DNA-binding /Mis18, centromere assembly-domain-containing protein [Dichotomocladium elegans]|nr:yippee zinc-binding/DNA-binding /Mis18, centromere assembly-domain-containing protein [Dichotomocladium elegans]